MSSTFTGDINVTSTGSTTARTLATRFAEVFNVKDFGAVGDGVANDTTAFQDVIQAIKDRARTSRQFTTNAPGGDAKGYLGTEVYVPEGIYKLDYDTLLMDDLLNATWRGAGSRWGQDFFDASTRLVFAGTSSGYGIRITSNGARNVRFEHMSIEYTASGSAFTGNLVEVEDNTGFSAYDVTFSDDNGNETTGTQTYSAASLLKLIGTGKYIHLERCYFRNAQRGIYRVVDSGSAPNLVNVVSCFFQDWKVAAVQDNAIGQGTIKIDSCVIELLNLKQSANPSTAPDDGLIINSFGFSIVNTFFTGGLLNDTVPNNQWCDLKGTGVLVGCDFKGSATGSVVWAANGMIAGNYFRGDVPLVIKGGRYKEFGNTFDPDGSKAVSIGPSGTGGINGMHGPSRFESFTGNSYVVEQDLNTVLGRIIYNANADVSTAGPIVLGGYFAIEALHSRRTDKTTDYTLTLADTGGTFSNSGATTQVDFTLPDCVLGLKYRLVKVVTNQTITINRAGSDLIWWAAAGGNTATTLTNSANEKGAFLEIEAISDTAWLITALRGTWT